MQAHETKLGDLPFSKETVVEGTATFFSLPKFQDRKERAYVDMCKWLKGFLLVPSDGPIEQNGQNWTTDVFTIQRVRPHANHHLPFKYWGSPKISFPEDSHQDDTAFWLHFPVNNETWMNVSQTVFICYHWLIRLYRRRYTRAFRVADYPSQ